MRTVTRICDVCGEPLARFSWSVWITARLVRFRVHGGPSQGVEMCEDCWGRFRQFVRRNT